MNIAGVVVLYNPEYEIIENIQTYLPFLKKLYVMDNSTKAINFIDEIKKFDKVEYVSLNGNKGIAKALKDATEKAITDGFDYILSMDQDSKYPTEDFKYIEDYIENNDMSKVGIVAINYSGNGLYLPTDGNKEYFFNVSKDCYFVISSGMIINLENYKKISGYDEDLFIEFVDVDICYQMKNKDLKIIFFQNILLDHKLGEFEERKFLWLKRTRSWHSPVRYYYTFRNYYYLREKKHNDLYIKRCYGFYGTIYWSVFSERKWYTYKMIRQGIRDGKRGILGPYQERRK